MEYQYWKDKQGFKAQSKLLQNFFRQQEKGFKSETTTSLSWSMLAEKQRTNKVGCIYFSGSRVDNKFCLGSRNVGILHSALPTDYIKAIAPAFHGDHDELIVCTDGRVVIEYSQSLSENAAIEIVTLNPGDYFIAKCGYPHRISLAPLRMIAEAKGDEINLNLDNIEQVRASFLAVKMGALTGKSSYEDLSKWKQRSFSHPLIENWAKDEEFLKKLRMSRKNCELLNLEQQEG